MRSESRQRYAYGNNDVQSRRKFEREHQRLMIALASPGSIRITVNHDNLWIGLAQIEAAEELH